MINKTNKTCFQATSYKTLPCLVSKPLLECEEKDVADHHREDESEQPMIVKEKGVADDLVSERGTYLMISLEKRGT